MMITRSLCRQLQPGESVSFDSGRIVVKLQEKTGRRARLSFTMRQDVLIDMPGDKPEEARMAPLAKSKS